ncbi:MAG: phosphoribosylamine--glycine ligase [Desulfovibrio sp.]|uniref:phosphoribosylamine--glycine ligase n=1 Tax=Desulfovibrio sp. 7SRBS1 TaxID=3378064 RepID=UPI003B3C971F
MNILLIGSGGREHALAWKLGQSPKAGKIYIAPGNGGTAQCGINVDIQDDDVRGIVDFAKSNDIGLVVPGPELPLTLGLADALKDAGIPCFGPSEYCAKLEGSKSFAKQVMLETGVPTAHFAMFRDADRALEFIEEKGVPLVVKADGLAAGKGVIICESKERARHAIEQIMVHKQFGTSGDKVIIEEMLVGEEVSFLAFSDGRNIKCMPSSQDHKAVGEGDTGANTGGMGAYSPAGLLPVDQYEIMAEEVITPIIRYMEAKGHPFVGVLYAGLMMTENGPGVLEYNVRFGDPECQPLMMRLDSDLLEIMLACTQGKLNEVDVKWRDDTALCVVMAAKGYPEAYPKGMRITGIERAENSVGVKVFQAGTKEEGGIVSSGGRVLGVTALGDDLAQSQERAYQAVDIVNFENSYVRRDIGDKGKKWENS